MNKKKIGIISGFVFLALATATAGALVGTKELKTAKADNNNEAIVQQVTEEVTSNLEDKIKDLESRVQNLESKVNDGSTSGEIAGGSNNSGSNIEQKPAEPEKPVVDNRKVWTPAMKAKFLKEREGVWLPREMDRNKITDEYIINNLPGIPWEHSDTNLYLDKDSYEIKR